MTMDPRLKERRRQVAEDRARRSITRLLRILVTIAVLGVAVWLVFSPYLSIAEVRTAGIHQSATNRILVEAGVVAGAPMALMRIAAVEAQLEEDPWIADARVDRHWPDTVIVRIDERVPEAWVETSAGWSRRAGDGVAVPSGEQPDSSLPWVRLTAVSGAEAESSPPVLGAIEFVASLPQDLQGGALVKAAGDGELWAQVAGYQVRLGRPVEMRAKALSLTALLRESPPHNKIITLIAPTHPALTPLDPTTPATEKPQ